MACTAQGNRVYSGKVSGEKNRNGETEIVLFAWGLFMLWEGL